MLTALSRGAEAELRLFDVIFTRKKAGKAPPAKPKDKQDTQKELLKAALRPGREVNIAMSTDLVSDLIDVRASMLHDITPKGLLLLAQTSPPIMQRVVGQTVELTFLITNPDKPGHHLRVGYKTKLLKIIEGFDMQGGFRDNVLVAMQPTRLSPTTLRLHYRVEPHSEVPLQLRMANSDTEFPILDLSVGGARVTHPSNLHLEHGQTVYMEMLSNGLYLELKCKVVRTDMDAGASKRGPIVSALHFVDLDAEIKGKLSNLINEIARLQRARDSGL